jgi:hypothetical protein
MRLDPRYHCNILGKGPTDGIIPLRYTIKRVIFIMRVSNLHVGTRLDQKIEVMGPGTVYVRQPQALYSEV